MLVNVKVTGGLRCDLFIVYFTDDPQRTKKPVSITPRLEGISEIKQHK